MVLKALKMYFIPYDVVVHSMYICKKWNFNKIF